MSGISRSARTGVLAFLIAVVSGCANIDQKGAEALAFAGQSAADALVTQTESSRKYVLWSAQIHQVQHVFSCRSTDPSLAQGCIDDVKPTSPDVQSKVQQVAEIMSKRELAFHTLKEGYSGFADLVAYDARGEVAKSLTAMGGTLDILMKTLNLPAVGSVMQKAAGDLLGTVAEHQKKEQILITSRALHAASNSLALALRAERNTDAVHSWLRVSTSDQSDLYAALIDTGLVAPRAVLGDILREQFPGIVIAPAPPAGDTAIVRGAARISYLGRSADRQRAAIEAYDKAVDALNALSAQHAKLEAGAPLDLATLAARVKEIQQFLKELDRRDNGDNHE